MTPDYERLFTKAMNVRGALINDTIFLEKVIDNWMAKYFCKNKARQNELFELVFCHERLNYNSKIQIFIALVGEHCSKFLEQHPKLYIELEDIGKHRNIFAHWMLDTSENKLKSGELRFLKAKDYKKYEHYTNTKVIQITEQIDKLKVAINDLAIPPLE